MVQNGILVCFHFGASKPTTRTSAENVMARAVLPVTIDFPEFTTFWKIKPFGLWLSVKNYDRKTKTCSHPLGGLSHQNCIVRD